MSGNTESLRGGCVVVTETLPTGLTHALYRGYTLYHGYTWAE